MTFRGVFSGMIRKNKALNQWRQLPAGSHFKIPGGRVFVKGEVIRKRIKCFELPI
jgi:hypothetical protein